MPYRQIRIAEEVSAAPRLSYKFLAVSISSGEGQIEIFWLKGRIRNRSFRKYEIGSTLAIKIVKP